MNTDLELFLKTGCVPRGEQDVIFLGCPYSHPDSAVVRERVHLASSVAVKLLELDNFVISPLSFTDLLAPLGRPKSGWYRYCLDLLALCNRLFVIQADGWKESEGLRLEISSAIGSGKSVEYLDMKYVENLLSGNADYLPF